jgi:hypothetical protein
MKVITTSDCKRKKYDRTNKMGYTGLKTLVDYASCFDERKRYKNKFCSLLFTEDEVILWVRWFIVLLELSILKIDYK